MRGGEIVIYSRANGFELEEYTPDNRECEECDVCEREIGLCPMYAGGNNKITWMQLCNADAILEKKRNR